MKNIIVLPFRALLYIISMVTGKFVWQSPLWIKLVSKVIKRYPLLTTLISLLVLASFSTYFYYSTLPQPPTVQATANTLTVPNENDDLTLQQLLVRFDYAPNPSLSDEDSYSNTYPSVARLDLIGKQLDNGIQLKPKKNGIWQWEDDRTLTFTPETHWPAGIEYEIEFSPSIFTEHTRLASKTVLTHTPELQINVEKLSFYQDPTNVDNRRVVATLTSTHPLDTKEIESYLKMSMRPSDTTISTKLNPISYTLEADQNQRRFYIQTQTFPLPANENFMSLEIDKGITSILGGAATQNAVLQKVVVPDIYSFLKVESEVGIVRNTQNIPEQIISLSFTDPIHRSELNKKLSIYLLPSHNPVNRRSYWNGPREVTQSALEQSQKLEFDAIINKTDSSPAYHLRVDVPENRYIYLKIEPGLTSANQFVHANLYDNVLSAPNYPKEVAIYGEGSVLALSGDKQISIQSRGINGLKITTGRLLDNQLAHLISQSNGDLKNPYFTNWNFNEQNIAVFSEEIQLLAKKHPKQANYSSFDLSEKALEKGQYGLYFVDVKAYDLQSKNEIYGINDKRLLLITDLGILVKTNADQSHEVFVQSIVTGEPVANAQVELLGKNGQAVYQSQTNRSGHASIPVTSGLYNDKQPVAFVVKSGTDTSFMPFNQYSRQINYSRFDIGGIQASQYQPKSLNAFVFNDRGIYRPGETVNLGVIVKQADLSTIENIPLELSITDARNRQIKNQRFILPKFGFYDYKLPTEQTGSTGKYRASVYLVRDNRYRGKLIGSSEFSVEEFQPDTLKIKSELVNTETQGWNLQSELKARVKLENLFGTPAQSRKVTAKLNVTPSRFSFNQFKEYNFSDPYDLDREKPLNLTLDLPTKQTNADGETDFDLDLSAFRSGTYLLEFIAEGFDQAGGRSVIAKNSALISPLEALVGYKADGKLDYIHAQSKRSLEFIAIDNTANRVKLDSSKMQLFELETKFSLAKQPDGTLKYQTIQRKKLLKETAIVIPTDGQTYNIDTTTPGDYLVKILDKNELPLASVSYSVVGEGNTLGSLDRESELVLKLDKKDYKAGSTIEMQIKTPYAGSGLITIESSKIHNYKWFKTDKKSSLQTIDIPENIEGNAYVNVTFVRDIGSNEIFANPLSYAVQPLSIDQSKRQLAIELDHVDIARPGKPMAINVSTSKAAKTVVFAIDEGILQVADYNTPKPLAHYLKKRALGVNSLQMLDLILPEFKLIQQQLSASGGGARALAALANNLNPFSRHVDTPAVFWSGIVDTSTDIKTVHFDIPETFSGQLRVMAVAVGQDSLGNTQSSALVRGPFVLTPNTLVHAAPGDEFQATLGVTNLIAGSGKSAEVSIDIETSEHLTLLSSPTALLTIDEGSEEAITVRVKAKQKFGAATIKFSARHGDEDAHRSANISVRPATTYYNSLITGYDKDGKKNIPIKRHLHSELSNQSVSASASPLVVVDGLNDYLQHFPHGCTEQVVSKVFPLVGLMSHPAYSNKQEKVRLHFGQVVNKLAERQTADGGFAFWPNHNYSAQYPSIYAVHFLLDAQDQGFIVDSTLLNRAQSYLRSIAIIQDESLIQSRHRAHAIYLLTRMGTVTTNYLIDLEENLTINHEKSWQKDIVATYIAATYQLLQKQDEADRLQAKYRSSIAHQNLDDFYSPLALDAQYIYLLSKHFPEFGKKLDGNFVLSLIEKIYRGEYNTVSSAIAILGLGAYSELALDNNFKENIEFSLNTLTEKLAADLDHIPFASSEFSTDVESLDITYDKPIFYLMSQTGFDQNLPTEPISHGMEVVREFYNEQGESINQFEQGKDITVKIKVRSLTGKTLTNIALIDLLPGGFEVLRSSVNRNATYWSVDYTDIREDRVVFYTSVVPQVRELTYKVKLTTAGKFIVPPTYADSMYDRSIQAMSKPFNFEVIATQ